jgi:hypothetical protein
VNSGIKYGDWHAVYDHMSKELHISGSCITPAAESRPPCGRTSGPLRIRPCLRWIFGFS